ncbi:MAG: hypothetical protein GY862_11085, partial [Gammaproteobacteria bacterium]|nr:hypothetical protein [Gammaproteobacteria bacterium]
MNRHPLSRTLRRALRSWCCVALLLLFAPPAQAVPGPFVEPQKIWQAGGNPDYPLQGLQPPPGDGGGRHPAFADLDADGDLDLIMGHDDGSARYFENTGGPARPVYVERSGADNPCDRVYVGYYSAPALADLDADSDLDLAVRTGDGTLRYFENTGDPARPVYVGRNGADNPWDGVDVGSYSAPALADLDADGDLDLVIGADDDTLRYFENTGGPVRPVYVERSGADNPWDGADVGDKSAPALADLDADGDLDLAVG